MVSVPVWNLSHFMPRRSKQLVIFGASFPAAGFTASRSLPDRCGVGAGPRDWTGISPDGDVITGDANGDAVNNGPFDSYLP